MDRKSRLVTYLPLWIICLVLLGIGVYLVYGFECRTHPSPECTIGNGFDQPVTVYVDGEKMVRVKPGYSKIFYPWETIPYHQTEFTLELRSDPGAVLYSRLFTIEELTEYFRYGHVRWINEDSQAADTGGTPGN